MRYLLDLPPHNAISKTLRIRLFGQLGNANSGMLSEASRKGISFSIVPLNPALKDGACGALAGQGW